MEAFLKELKGLEKPADIWELLDRQHRGPPEMRSWLISYDERSCLQHWAVTNSCTPALDWLAERRSLCMGVFKQRDVLKNALWNGDKKMLIWLRDHGLTDEIYCHSAIRFAMQYYHFESLKQLADLGTDVAAALSYMDAATKTKCFVGMRVRGLDLAEKLRIPLVWTNGVLIAALCEGTETTNWVRQRTRLLDSPHPGIVKALLWPHSREVSPPILDAIWRLTHDCPAGQIALAKEAIRRERVSVIFQLVKENLITKNSCLANSGAALQPIRKNARLLRRITKILRLTRSDLASAGLVPIESPQT
jgi:hypothetical protein